MSKDTYQFTSAEKDQIRQIEGKTYMPPILAYMRCEVEKADAPKKGWRELLDKLHDVLRATQSDVDKIQQARKDRGEIRDPKQASKAIAGHAFQNMLQYAFLMNKRFGNIDGRVFITGSKTQFQDVVTINIGTETQKPDADLFIYTLDEHEKPKRCMLLSLKTSLRERAGQTYKWKLLLEIATTDNPIKEKYDMKYTAKTMPLVCFATVNFYNEINAPQHRGMFKFFDQSFIAKAVDTALVMRLSTLPDYVNRTLLA